MRPNPAGRGSRKPRKPLDSEQLDALALHYVGRYATSRAKLIRYLDRKIRERGWDGASGPDVGGLVERFVRAGYINDAAYAATRARDLSLRGYGEGRLRQRLYADGIAEEDREEAQAIASEQGVDAALRFAARRRFGPYASTAIVDEKARERALSAMVRAGHGFALAKKILAMAPGEEPDRDALSVD